VHSLQRVERLDQPFHFCRPRRFSMSPFRRFAPSFLALALAVAVLTLAVPRAAHAVVATLAPVTNTVSNPAITSDVSKQSGQLVHLVVGTNSSGARTNFGAVSTTGGPLTLPYTIPANQNLVITDVDLIPTSLCAGTVTTVNIGNGGFL